MSAGAPTLLETVRRLLERTYRADSGLGDLAPFVVGDAGYRLLYSGGVEVTVGACGAVPARTLLRQTRDEVRARIYFPDALIRRLEQRPPQHGLDATNVDEFATFVEEIDHLLQIAERARQGRAVSLFELELHANVSKHLVLARFLAGRRDRLGPGLRLWLRRRLFGDARYAEEDPAVRGRYRDAARWAVRLLDRLRHLRPAARLEALRAFHAAGSAGKLELIGRLSG